MDTTSKKCCSGCSMSSSQTTSESSATTELVTINLDRKLQSTIGPDHEEKVKLEVEFPLPKYPFLYLLPFCLQEHFSAPTPPLTGPGLFRAYPFPSSIIRGSPGFHSLKCCSTSLITTASKSQSKERPGVWLPSPPSSGLSTGCLSPHTTLAASGRNR